MDMGVSHIIHKLAHMAEDTSISRDRTEIQKFVNRLLTVSDIL